MTTPQSTFSKANENANETARQIKSSTPHSVYCADCLCGRHFETSSREWIYPDCHRYIVLDWQCSQHGPNTQEAA